MDDDRLMIDGACAGGYTPLCALIFRNAFRAGARHFGVSDAEALARDTHKFQSRNPASFSAPMRNSKIFITSLTDKFRRAHVTVHVLLAKALSS